MSAMPVSTPYAFARGDESGVEELGAGQGGALSVPALRILLPPFVTNKVGCTFRFEHPHDYVAATFEVPRDVRHVVPVCVRVNLLGEMRVAVSPCASYKLTALLWTYANFCSVMSGQITRTYASSVMRGVMLLQLDASAHGADHELAHARACRLFLHGLDQLCDGIGGIRTDHSIYLCLQALDHEETLRSHAGNGDGDECAADGGISDNDPEEAEGKDPEDAEGKQEDGEGKKEEEKEDRRLAHEAGIARAVAAAFYCHSVEPELAVWARLSS